MTSSRERARRIPTARASWGYAARVMRRLIIDHARNRQAQKRGGQFELTSLGVEAAGNAVDDRELTRISKPERLAKRIPPSLKLST